MGEIVKGLKEKSCTAHMLIALPIPTWTYPTERNNSFYHSES